MTLSSFTGEVVKAVVYITPDGRMDEANAAVYLSYSRATLASWRCRGVGPASLRLRGRVWYRQSELDRWLREGDTNEPL